MDKVDITRKGMEKICLCPKCLDSIIGESSDMCSSCLRKELNSKYYDLLVYFAGIVVAFALGCVVSPYFL